MTVAGISLAWLRTRSAAQVKAVAARHLSVGESERLETLPGPRRRLEWLAGRLAVKQAVRAYQRRRPSPRGVQPAREIVVIPCGTPEQAGMPRVAGPVEVGITHSGDFALAACAAGPVGIDLERDRPFAPALLAALGDADFRHAAPGTPAMPIALRWACREAVLKNFGFGMRVDPREIALTRWRPDGSFGWSAGPGLRRAAATSPWPRRAWAGELSGYALALVW
ncbi:hypothetical protein JK358_15955 [Nocardia sp. 2]|uniref:4'-phosphopantetheinyl transferase n=1 Tax=Nocardia acididurans TaxID=2802282 RepID=A0ABS1M6I2_9NOCA|nr:4'-phosphopantetheinyl transferase superfamily protein [Nocardia acididurans]MBL1075891.1 hypothetical protein [Nocardia acididurans]